MPAKPTLSQVLCQAAATSLILGNTLFAADLHVANTGKDTNPGSSAAPLQTLSAARDAARQFVGKEPVTIHVADGIYYLPETLVFKPEDSGTKNHPVRYQSKTPGGAVLSGGMKLDLDWKPFRDGILQASTPPQLDIDQLFINGARQRMARYPNYDANKPTAAYQGFAADAFSKVRAANWADPSGGYIHAMHSARWGGYHYRITGKKPDGEVSYEGGWQNNRQMGMHKEFRMVENIFEELDAPGEWFHNRKTNTLYFMPDTTMNLSTATVEVARLKHLVEFQGSQNSPVKNISIQGFTFRHAARTFMDTKEPLLRSDWTIYRGGAVLLAGTEDVSILDSEFDQVGGNAIFVNNYNRRALIKGCHIHDAGASGVCFVGDPNAVRDPLFEYAQTNDLTKIDRTPGPKSDNYPADSTVEDCLIHGIGRVERQPAGVQISMAAGITVRDTSIYDCARAGINISEGTWGGHLIERCDVFDTVLETHDHGSFNSWGRDRFWVNNHRGISQPEVKKDPKLPYLDAVKPTIIRDSRWRCDHGWDIDLDDGSSNYVIYNNLMLAGGLKFREGYGRKAYNNILINNGFHPHVWFDDSSSEFRHNIVMHAHAPIGQPEGWGKRVDENFFLSEGDRTRHMNSGADAQSLSGDPEFTDPSSGDFSVKDTSPALKVGFKNFSMTQFGVKKPSLKALAKTPVIPALNMPTNNQNAEIRSLFWLGAPLHSLTGQEFSAFGVSKDDGGVQLVKVPKSSPAAAAGLRENDLIQGINGIKVSTTEDLFAALATLGAAPIKPKLIRNQRPFDITLSGIPYTTTETANSPDSFSSLPTPKASSLVISTNIGTNNEPLSILTDGVLAPNYGPVFANGISTGSYKIDLGASKSVTAFSAWSYNKEERRGRQSITLFGSNSPTDPGWKTADTTVFTALGSIDTHALKKNTYTATSLRAQPGKSLGTFRWLVIESNPASDTVENTAWQEMSVESTTP